MELWELVARESIRDLVARYNANGDSGRLDDVLALFAPDAVMDVEGVRHEGVGAIRAMFAGSVERMQAWTGPPLLRHFTSATQIDVASPDTATARSYFLVVMAHGVDHWGRYLDEFRVVDGAWRFAMRRVVVDGETPDGWSAGRHDHAP